MGKERFFWEKAGRLRADSQRISHCGIRVRNSMLPRNPRMYQMRCFRNSRSPFVSPFHSPIRERWRRRTRSFSSRLGSLAISPRSKLSPRPMIQGLPYAALPIMASSHPERNFSTISWISLGAFSGGIWRIFGVELARAVFNDLQGSSVVYEAHPGTPVPSAPYSPSFLILESQRKGS